MIWRIATFAGFGLTFGIIGFWMSERTPPTDILEVEVLTPFVQPGGDLRVRYTVFRRANCRTRFQRTYRDYDGVRFAAEDIDLAISPAPLGRDTYVQLVPISQRAGQGEASMRAINVYYCNPLHVLVSWPIVQVAADVAFVISGDPVQSLGPGGQRGP